MLTAHLGDKVTILSFQVDKWGILAQTVLNNQYEDVNYVFGMYLKFKNI